MTGNIMRTLIPIILINLIFLKTSFADTVLTELPGESVKKEKNKISNQSDLQFYETEIIEPVDYILSKNYPNPFNPAS